MYNQFKTLPTNECPFETTEMYVGESIETKIRRMAEEKEPIKDAVGLIHTEENEGVPSDYNIRTDKWEIALETMNKMYENKTKKRKDNKPNEIKKIEENPEKQKENTEKQNENTATNFS